MQKFIVEYGYWALFILAFLESACVPIPSEVTFGYAGALTAAEFAGPITLDIVPVILVGVAGSVAGSVFAYEVGRSAGRAMVDRWGKWILLTHADLDRAEVWFSRWGKPSVLFGRVIPVIRTVISLPAGVAKMARIPFIVLTTIGCAVWVTTLTLLGHAAGANWQHMAGIVHKFEWPIIIVVVIVAIWGFVHRWRQVKAHHARQQ